MAVNRPKCSWLRDRSRRSFTCHGRGIFVSMRGQRPRKALVSLRFTRADLARQVGPLRALSHENMQRVLGTCALSSPLLWTISTSAALFTAMYMLITSLLLLPLAQSSASHRARVHVLRSIRQRHLPRLGHLKTGTGRTQTRTPQ
ncbi:hypothetical protein EXIGLDRAFT_171609 [Exidia glandulosa HHB12029]|uniref:Uncharacterized protein n=1 Tax=Exidia glandulosa HHB12029 TaxID=1314781 RepID=A0A165FBA3_EXIGL|nr:hypothetical protein EXIGLDRAFT_171609 [Exidia glandulosa HHB12029]